MKPSTPRQTDTRKLRLTRETLRQLDDASLSQVIGGFCLMTRTGRRTTSR
jgi:hypothetical protein